jgi:hypothetical protein
MVTDDVVSSPMVTSDAGFDGGLSISSVEAHGRLAWFRFATP